MSFKKKQNTKTDDNHIPKVNNIFFGHPDLDCILENKLRTGTLIILEQDELSKFSNYLQRHFIGSAYHSNQHCFIYQADFSDTKANIPQILKTPIKKESNNKQDKNVIAWRYQNMQLSQHQQHSINSHIPILDLSRNVPDNQLNTCQLNIQKTSEFQSLPSLLEHIINSYQNSLIDFNDKSFKKILIEGLFTDLGVDQSSTNSKEYFRFLNNLKIVVKSSFCMCMIVVPPYLDLQLKQMLLQQCDLYLKVQGQLENQVFMDFQGILNILKVPVYNSYANIKLNMLSWGIQAVSKKQINIVKLYLAPEKEEQQQQNNQPVKQGNMCGKSIQLNNTYEF